MLQTNNLTVHMITTHLPRLEKSDRIQRLLYVGYLLFQALSSSLCIDFHELVFPVTYREPPFHRDLACPGHWFGRVGRLKRR